MANRDRASQPLDCVTFRCVPCARTFDAAPARVVDDAERTWHPWSYWAPCPACGAEVAQAAWQRGLLKAWACATGPRTPEGIAATTRNLEGHPTPEETRRTRFNAMKHGLSARTASYFPAKPDGYAFCATCSVDRAYCAEQPACLKQTEHFLLHHAAFDQGNPKHLNGIYADFHAALMATVGECLRQIIGDGVTVRTPRTYVDKDGRCLVVEYIDSDGQMKTVHDVAAHPLFRPVSELISRVGIDLANLGMTGRQQAEGEEVPGHLTAEREAESAFRARQVAALENLAATIAGARQAAASDPVLLEYQRQTGEGGHG